MIGGIKALLDRFKSNVAYLQFPLLLYLSYINTLDFFADRFEMMQWVVLLCVIMFVLFCIGLIYIDYRWVFPMEMSFMFRKTPHLERRFDIIEKNLDDLIYIRC